MYNCNLLQSGNTATYCLCGNYLIQPVYQENSHLQFVNECGCIPMKLCIVDTDLNCIVSTGHSILLLLLLLFSSI